MGYFKVNILLYKRISINERKIHKSADKYVLREKKILKKFYRYGRKNRTTLYL